jgi:flagellar biosynthesis protein FlhG
MALSVSEVLPVAAPRTRRQVWSIGGGKGGIGKSLLAASVGWQLARMGRRVVLVDADLGGANLHTCLGLPEPKFTLSDFVEHRVERIEEVLVPSGIPNLALVSGALDHLDAADPKYAQKMRLLRHIQAMDVDYAILDLGAGTHRNVLDFFLVADHGILVLVPEPSAVENVYRFVKAAFWRRVRNVAAVYGFEATLQAVLGEGSWKSPVEVLEALSARSAEAGELLREQLRAFRPCLVVNQARTWQDAQIGEAVVGAWRRFFGLELDYLGHVEYDDEFWRTVRARRPLLLGQRVGAAEIGVARVTDRLLTLDAARRPERS